MYYWLNLTSLSPIICSDFNRYIMIASITYWFPIILSVIVLWLVSNRSFCDRSLISFQSFVLWLFFDRFPIVHSVIILWSVSNHLSCDLLILWLNRQCILLFSFPIPLSPFTTSALTTTPPISFKRLLTLLTCLAPPSPILILACTPLITTLPTTTPW